MADLYEALALAETGGEENPWIRTKVKPKGGSSAFGPVQITSSLIKDALNRGLLSPQSAQFAAEVMLPMQTKMLRYGGQQGLADNLKIYDYGGTGNFDVNSYGDMYRTLADELINIKLKESSSNETIDYDNFLKAWRGMEPEAKYRKRFYKGIDKKISHYRR